MLTACAQLAMKGLKMSNDVSGGTPKGNRFTLAMSGRDLMTIGLFLAIYIVLYFAVTIFGFLTPVMMLATLGLSVVIGAIPFMLFLSRVRHAGMVGLFAIVLGIVLLIVGFPPAVDRYYDRPVHKYRIGAGGDRLSFALGGSHLLHHLLRVEYSPASSVVLRS